MNPSNQRSGGIEKKFFVAIFWVGILPMTITLIVAYVFARESQWVTTKRNLTTAVRRTTEGLKLAINTRLNITEKISTDPLFEKFLKLPSNERNTLIPEITEKLKKVKNTSDGKTISLAILDTNKNILVALPDFNIGTEIIPEWHTKIEKPKIISITTFPSSNIFTFTIGAPIKDRENSNTIGFLLEIQSIDELIEFALGSSTSASEGLGSEHIYYSLSYLSEKGGISIFKSPPKSPISAKDYYYEPVDKRLLQRIKRAFPKNEGILTLFSFMVNNKRLPVLIAFQKIFPEYELYTIVFRPFYEIFWFIHVGSIVALILAGMVILIFSIIGYRIVNKNILLPLSLINEGAQIIRQGDLDLKLKIATGDELQEVAESFNEMASTLRKNIRKLEESEERYRNLVNSMRDGIFQTDENGKITFINPAGAKILGYSQPETAIGTSINEFLVSDDDFEYIKNQLTTTGFIHQHRIWIKPYEGEPICIEISADRKKDPLKKVYILEGIFRDITQNVLLEKEVHKRAERIRAVNLIAQSINSSLEVGKVYETILEEIKRLIPSADLVLLAINKYKSGDTDSPSVEYEILKSSSKNVEEIPIPNKSITRLSTKKDFIHYDFLQSEDEEIAKEFPPRISSLLGIPLYTEQEFLGCLILASETPKVFSSHEINTVEELAPHIAVAIRNAKLLEKLRQTLDEVNQAKEQLNMANEELKTLDEMKTNLLSNVSHELRTPLVAVMGYTDMVLKGKAGPITENQKEFLTISMRNIEKLVTLIDNLLDFSKLYKGKEELIFSTFDLIECVEYGIQNIRPMAEPRGITLEVIYPEKPILVDGDKGKILQVLNNLLSNAVKFNKNNGAITVTIEKVEDREVEISVSDTGIGIPEEALDKIFTRFYQVDSSSTRKYGGAGIGLAISQDIIRLHGSTISVKSKLGEGSTFSFRLPLHGRSPKDHAKFDKELTPEETHLLVELVTQDRGLNAQIRQWLIEENIDVISALHQSAAVSLFLKYSPDCIIIDCEDSPLAKERLREIIENPALENAPLVVLTDDNRIGSLYPDKAISTISKSFGKSKLISAIRYTVKASSSEIPSELGDKILYLDNEELTKLVKPILESSGYKVEAVTTGEGALEKILTGEFRVLISEITLPGLDIWETCKIIRSNPQLRRIKIIITTTKTPQEVEENCKKYNLHIDGLLPKPFTADDLLSVVNKYFSVSHK
ncbi:MAG: ATP-binding protein [Candidatus Hydrogenedentes bacterium]|nr:ATP-binding protein [Candidatus Hydrogenedentota bacterium]